MRSPIIFVVFFALLMSAYGADPTRAITVDEARRKHLLTEFVRPAYPDEAKRHLWTGRGVFELKFNPTTGRVREVHVVKSTGHGILDASAIGALKRWTAKPGSIYALKPFPIEFTYTR